MDGVLEAIFSAATNSVRFLETQYTDNMAE
jgi:hypothetical protein